MSEIDLKQWVKSRKFWLGCSLIILLAAFWLSLPDPLFSDPTSTIIEDVDGQLLGARIAGDGQWRFPEVDSVPRNLELSILQFEDAWFRWHPGVNPVSMVRAAWQNLQADDVVSGGSTITMQVVRLSRKNQARTYFEKLIEIWLAFRLEASYSKDEILQLYTSFAPYGGNVVGAEAASWRYFQRPLWQLSWAEAATLAVLPNAPALMHPGRNRDELRAKRDRLLKKLSDQGIMDSVSCSLAMMEPLPIAPQPLPMHAFHLLDYAVKEGREGERVSTTVRENLQREASARLDRYARFLGQSEVNNACALIVNVQTNAVEAYIGNARTSTARAPYVDLIQAKRSSGSILKPFLYGEALAAGMIHTQTLMRDVPMVIGQFSPENFDKSFDGMVPAGQALARSLNVPAASLLQNYGLVPFYEDLKNLGISTLHRPAAGYGLTLILGGAETQLWNLAGVYAQQGRSLLSATRDSISGYSSLQVFQNDQPGVARPTIHPGAWWLVTEALTEVQRPGIDMHWRSFSSSRKIAWKTGTSHGFRDAWAVGYDAGYLVAVWVGNADGEGRPGMTGTSTAAPLMFELFNLLPEQQWFDPPEANLRTVSLCEISGFAPSPECPKTEVEIPIDAALPTQCNMHQRVYLSEQNERVFHDCAQGPVRDTVWFQLDPVAGYYYQTKHASYTSIPPFSGECTTTTDEAIAIVYPAPNAEIIIPRNFQGEAEAVQFIAAHNDPKAVCFWHLDQEFIGQTTGNHKLILPMKAGTHRLKVVDGDGNEASCSFKVFEG